MKTVLGLLFALSASAWGQGNNLNGQVSWGARSTAPSGACSARQAAVYTPSGGIYTCVNGTWTLLSSGGGGGVSSVGLVGTANQITITGASPITSSGSWTLSIPTNPTLPGNTTGTFIGNITGNVTGNVSGTAPAGMLTGTTLAANVVSSSLTSVGTIVTGAWSGTAITNVKGGTGGDSSAVTGLAHVATGTWSYSALVNADITAATIVATTKLSATGTKNSTTFLRGDDTWAAPAGTGTVTVVGAGNLTSTAFVTGGGTTTLQTPSATSTLDSSGNATFAGTVAATSISTGTSPPSSSVCAAGTAGGLCLGEGTTPTGTLLAVGVLWENSSNHRLELINNNSTSSAVPTLISADAFTNKTYNGLTVTSTTGTFTLTNGKTLSVSNTLTLAGTDSTTMTFPSTSAAIARTDAANTFTGTQTIGALVATTVNGNTFTTGTGVLTIAASKTLTISNSITLAGTDATTMTLPGTSQTLPGMNQTNTAGSSMVWDLSAASVTAGLKIPSAAGAVPTADGFEATNTTNHTHVWGSNGTTMVGAIAATGTGTATTCTNQFVSVISSIAVPTCTTVTLAGPQFANQGTTTTVLHGNGAGNPAFGAVVSADLNITTTTCTAPTVLTAISAGGVGTCTAPLLTQNSQSAAYTTVLGDAGKMIYHPGADTTARTFTIDSNANVAYAIGTCISFFNDTSAGTLTIAITSDTMILAGAGTTGSRTLTASNEATACKMTSTRWIISGSSGLT